MTGRTRPRQAHRDARAEDAAAPGAELAARPPRPDAPRRSVRLVCGRCRRRVGVVELTVDLATPPAPRCRCGYAPRYGRSWWESALDVVPPTGGTLTV